MAIHLRSAAHVLEYAPLRCSTASHFRLTAAA